MDDTLKIPELSVVALRHPVECKGDILPQGGKGTVVHVYRDDEHYEVEFAEPFPRTVTLRRDDIRAERANCQGSQTRSGTIGRSPNIC